MRPSKIGVPIEAMAEFGPYELYMSDVFACSTCGKEIAVIVASAPLTRHHDPDYQRTREAFLAGNVPADGQKAKVIQYWETPQEHGLYLHNLPETKELLALEEEQLKLRPRGPVEHEEPRRN
jgi:hypothetical protein